MFAQRLTGEGGAGSFRKNSLDTSRTLSQRNLEQRENTSQCQHGSRSGREAAEEAEHLQVTVAALQKTRDFTSEGERSKMFHETVLGLTHSDVCVRLKSRNDLISVA